MEWPALYEIVKEQAYWSVLRYEESARRKDKIQELVCMSFEKYQRDIAAGREIKKQDYKCFVTQRAKQVDTRSVVKKGGGGTSTMDPLGFYRRRPDSSTPVIEFADWMIVNPKSKQSVDDAFAFNIDYKSFMARLNSIQKKVLDLLIQGYKVSKIAEKIKTTSIKVKQIIQELQQRFLKFFDITLQNA